MSSYGSFSSLSSARVIVDCRLHSATENATRLVQTRQNKATCSVIKFAAMRSTVLLIQYGLQLLVYSGSAVAEHSTPARDRPITIRLRN